MRTVLPNSVYLSDVINHPFPLRKERIDQRASLDLALGTVVILVDDAAAYGLVVVGARAVLILPAIPATGLHPVVRY